MPREIDLPGLQKLLEPGDVQLIEVLPENEYEEEHLPGSINIPLKSMNPSSVSSLDRSLGTVVYCWDDI
ncbi:MAG: rhodanese-like domain-containing protein [Actinobacteria bacterium]|nr:rhodanese-like domain-containing protein [Actinomycetota bacterium]MDQ3533643.1 rhodanese-like domain-containing protein [Actinomycetota bacterium]